MDMITVYKITYGISGCPFEYFFLLSITIFLQEKTVLNSINIITTTISGSILFLKESSMIGTLFQVI